MLKLNLAAGGRLEVPPFAVIGVMKPAGEGTNPSAVLYDMGEGPRVDQLSDQYGFVKKLCIDGNVFDNVVEMEIVEKTTTMIDDVPVQVSNRGKLAVSRSRLVARRDMPDGGDAKARIYIAAGTGSMAFDITQTLDEMDGIDPADVKQKPAEDGPPDSPAPAETKPRRRRNVKDNADGND